MYPCSSVDKTFGPRSTQKTQSLKAYDELMSFRTPFCEKSCCAGKERSLTGKRFEMTVWLLQSFDFCAFRVFSGLKKRFYLSVSVFICWQNFWSAKHAKNAKVKSKKTCNLNGVISNRFLVRNLIQRRKRSLLSSRWQACFYCSSVFFAPFAYFAD